VNDLQKVGFWGALGTVLVTVVPSIERFGGIDSELAISLAKYSYFMIEATFGH
jgi:hypothetical protein